MESRGQGFQSNYFYIYEFMGEAQVPGRRGTRRKRAAAGLDEVSGSSCGTITSVRIPLPHFFAWTLELELEPWVSLWSNHFGEESTPPLAWTEGNKMPQPRCLGGGKQGVPERPNPLRRKSSLRYSERLRKNRSIRGFRFLSFLHVYMFNFLLGVCRSSGNPKPGE